MNNKFAVILLAVASVSAQAQTGPAWAWTAGKITNNGSISVKSAGGSSTYNAVQNPIGAVAKTNQSAVTQPPTVIIQATNGGYGHVMPLVAVSNSNPPPPPPSCPAGYTTLWTGSLPLNGPFKLETNVAGTRYNWGIWRISSNYYSGFIADNQPTSVDPYLSNLLLNQFLFPSNSYGVAGTLCGK